MRKVFGLRPSPAMVVAMTALFVALTATAIGLPGKNSIDRNDLGKRVVGPKNLRPNSVRGIHVVEGSLGEVRKAATARNSLNSLDVLWGVVDVDTVGGGAGANGATLVNGEGVTSAAFVGTNTNSVFRVNFDRDVSDCAWMANANSTQFGPPSIEETGMLMVDADTLEVRPFGSGGANYAMDDDDTISIVVTC